MPFPTRELRAVCAVPPKARVSIPLASRISTGCESRLASCRSARGDMLKAGPYSRASASPVVPSGPSSPTGAEVFPDPLPAVCV